MEELRERYARSVFELEFEEDVSPLVSRLRSMLWLAKVEMVTINGTPTLRVHARDINKAKLELPKVVAESDLTLLCYELTMPKLVAMSLSFIIALGVASIACYVYTVLLLGEADASAFLTLNLLMVLFFVVYLSVRLLFSQPF